MTPAYRWNNDPPEKLLVERFHITTGFHGDQRHIIERLVHGKRVLAIQRTGWGKSICYQMTSLYYPYLTIVFSPLKALMRDQHRRCHEDFHIPTAIVSSDFTDGENRATLHKAVNNQIKILFIAPERLSNPEWQEHITKVRISMVVIDEAHCISLWGHDFRPDYCRILNLLHTLPVNTPVLALTATANKRVEEDILQQIGYHTEVIRGTMKRLNLRLQVVSLHGDQEKLAYLACLLPQLPGTGIIYTTTRKASEMIVTFLRQQGIASQYYHAKRDSEDRRQIEQELLQNQHKVICATNALGMGIDKPDLRFVIHYHFPGSPIHYYQEIGRAGRDGNISYCILLYDKNDIEIQEGFIRNSKPSSEEYATVLSALQRSRQGIHEKDILSQTTLSSQTKLRIILTSLQDQEVIQKNQERRYMPTIQPYFRQIDISSHDIIGQYKMQDLQAMINYASVNGCYMDYLTSFLGDKSRLHCGACAHCEARAFPLVIPSASIKQAATQFLEGNFLPYPSASIDGIVSILLTKSGKLVETFIRRLADILALS
jgi:ATP-dependent DNA helicase RecQ